MQRAASPRTSNQVPDVENRTFDLPLLISFMFLTSPNILPVLPNGIVTENFSTNKDKLASLHVFGFVDRYVVIFPGAVGEISCRYGQ